MKRLAVALSLSLLPVVAFASGGSGGGGNGGGGGATGFPGVSLSLSKETAAPGALAQVKVFITEPKPITTGTGHLTFSAYSSISGIALDSHAQDTIGVALVRGSDINLTLVSPSATFGDVLDYPLLTIVGQVPPTMPIGAKVPFSIDATSLQLLDTTGAPYAIEVNNGFLVAGGGVSVGDVNPGSATLPAGSVVTITGNNFVPKTTVKFAEAKIDQVRYISPTRIDVVLGSPAAMHGQMIKVSNPDNTSDIYFSYQRTKADSRSLDPVMQYAVPLLPATLVTSAVVALPAPAPSTTYGVALQNIGTTVANATVNAIDAAGNTLATSPVSVNPSRYVVRELSELFGVVPDGTVAVSVTTDTPIEVLGIAADQINGTAKPIVAQ